MAPTPLQSQRQRHARVRRDFDGSVEREWARHQGEPWRVLRRTLRERFLVRHLTALRGPALELGPGPGRFTPLLRASVRGRVVAVDLSRNSLLAARRRVRSRNRPARVDWVQAAGERLPLRARCVDGILALGNIVSFASRDAPVLLSELARVCRPGARVVADFPSPVGSAQEFFRLASRRRFLGRVLRRPRYYFVDQVLDSGFQPFAPRRLGRWEFRFYTAEQASEELERAGFDVVDTMSVAPIARMDDRVIAVARRDAHTWRSLLRIEERAGRRPGTYESGDGFVVAAVRRRR